MKVAISTDGNQVAAHFGRCPEYTIVEILNDKVLNKEVIANPGHMPGFLPGYLSKLGVQCIIAGGMGPRAKELFANQNIETIIGVQGEIDEVIQAFIAGELQSGESLCERSTL